MIAVGDEFEHGFTVTAEDMRTFQALSNDDSLIHCDPGFARERGFKDVIVYGGLMLAQLSHVLGTGIPGRKGTSTNWSITYRSALYVDEPAVLRLKVVNVSPATGIVEGKFRVTAGDRTIASGTTQSIVPTGEVAPESADGR